jgi:hypothetical protein
VVAAAAGPALKQLHARYGDRVEFVTLYVREAHPGERVDQPQDAEAKMAHARAYQERDLIPWTVAVDDIDGTLHRQLGPADTGYVVGVDGRVVGRVLWAIDDRAVGDALEAAISGTGRVEGRTRVLAVLKSTSEQQRILGLAGPRARRDFMRVVPPAYLAGRIASVLPPMPPLARGLTAAAAATVAITGPVVFAWAWLRRSRR